MDKYKTCPDCKQTKSFDDFHKNKKMKDGFATYCKPCLLLRGKKYRDANPEKVKATQRASRNKNKDKVKLTKKLWRETNRDKVNAQKRARRAANADRYRELARAVYSANKESALNSAARRQAIKKQASVYSVTAEDLASIRKQPCLYCGSSELIEIDHVIPLARGGSHSVGNLAPACRSCNRTKSDLFVMEWKIRSKR